MQTRITKSEEEKHAQAPAGILGERNKVIAVQGEASLSSSPGHMAPPQRWCRESPLRPPWAWGQPHFCLLLLIWRSTWMLAPQLKPPGRPGGKSYQ